MIFYIMICCGFYGLMVGLRAEDLEFSDIFILLGWCLLWPIIILMFVYKVFDK